MTSTSNIARGDESLTGWASRLRTLPYLPPSQRPAIITSKAGAEINIDKVKVEGKERILRRGEVGPRSSLLSLFIIGVRAEVWWGSRRSTNG